MDSILMVFTLAVCLFALESYAYVTDEEFKRTLLTLRELEEQSEDQRSLGGCREFGESCEGIVNCCGVLNCYWKDGYSFLKKGECVKCMKEGQKCQRDSQCCSRPKALQCDRGNALWVDGTCAVYRSSGLCYRDGQCVNGCLKRWYETHGSCH